MAVAKHFAKRRKFFLREFLRERLILQEFYKDFGEIFAVYLAMLQKFNIIFLIFLSKYCNNSKIFTNFAPNLGISYLEMPNHTYKLRMQINFTSHFIEAKAT